MPPGKQATRLSLLLSCEHGGNAVPAGLRACFNGHEGVLETHRGLDIGALDLFRKLAPLAEHAAYATRSRLCIELNRSEHHPRLFSAFTTGLPENKKQEMLAFYRDYRNGFADQVAKRISRKASVVHVAVHSFTPVLDGVRRTVDIGLLYDPARPMEKAFCAAWGKAIRLRMPGLAVRMNQPYKGISDGFPTALRRQFPTHYAGIELEVNQRFSRNGRMDAAIARALHDSLRTVLQDPLAGP